MFNFISNKVLHAQLRVQVSNLLDQLINYFTAVIQHHSGGRRIELKAKDEQFGADNDLTNCGVARLDMHLFLPFAC